MEKRFKQFLISRGYKEITPSGRPSTVYDYGKRISRICKDEHLSWQGLAENIETILPQYDFGGCKEALGRKSHNAVINALRRFAEFISV